MPIAGEIPEQLSVSYHGQAAELGILRPILPGDAGAELAHAYYRDRYPAAVAYAAEQLRGWRITDWSQPLKREVMVRYVRRR